MTYHPSWRLALPALFLLSWHLASSEESTLWWQHCDAACVGDSSPAKCEAECISANADIDESFLLQRSVSSPMAPVVLEQGDQPKASHGASASDPGKSSENDASDLEDNTFRRQLSEASSSIWTKIKIPVLPEAKQDPGLDEWDANDTVTLTVMLLVLMLFDVFLQPRIHNHALALGFMVMASAVFCAFVWKQRGRDDGIAWATGYALEWALSMDNLFVFHLIFKAFSVPPEQSIRALGIGIYGAICFRVVFIAGLTHLFTLHWGVDVVIGIVLIISGLMTLQDEDEEDVQNLPTVRFFKWLLGDRLLDTYSDDGSMFTRNAGGQLQMTVLFLVVCVISVIDCVFAVDSVGSKTGQIKNLYINLTSSLMGMFSLRSLFFIIRDMADYFDYVKYGICSILCFVGLDMVFVKWVDVPLGWMCLIIVALFTSSVVASIIKATWFPNPEKDDDKLDLAEGAKS